MTAACRALDASGHAPSQPRLSCGQIRPEMITLDANVIGTVERSQDELIKERHASHEERANARSHSGHTCTRASCILAVERRGACALVAGAPRRRRRWARRRRRSTRVVALETACAYPPYRRRRSGLASPAGKDKISKRIYKKNFTIIEEKKKARRRRAAPFLARAAHPIAPRQGIACARRVPDGSRSVWCGQRFATTDCGLRRRADRALKCGDGDRCTRLRARRERSLRSQAIRDELVEREKGEKQKAVAKDELHAKHGALSRFAK